MMAARAGAKKVYAVDRLSALAQTFLDQAPNDPKAAAAVQFAAKVTQARGKVGADDVLAVKAAGYSDAQVIEIVQHVALNTWTNYINEVAKTEIDFPVVALREAA